MVAISRCFGSLALFLTGAGGARIDRKRIHSDASSATEKASGGKVVALGDSYSAGTGIHTWGDAYEGGDCWREWNSSTGALYAKSVGEEFVNAACKRGTLPQFPRQFAKLQADFPEDAASGWAGSVLHLTLGGNDIYTVGDQSWPFLLIDCLLSIYGPCHEKAENQIGNWETVQQWQRHDYRILMEGAPNAKIRVMGYPRLFTRTWHCIFVPGLNLKTADWADGMIDELNRRTRESIDAVRGDGAVDIEFVDVADFVNGGACWGTQNLINGVVLGSKNGISDASMHPNQRGYDAYFNALSENLGGEVSKPMQGDVVSQAADPKQMALIFQGWDKNDDGKLSVDEVLRMVGGQSDPAVPKHLRSLFRMAHKSQDDGLSLEEFGEFTELAATVPPP